MLRRECGMRSRDGDQNLQFALTNAATCIHEKAAGRQMGAEMSHPLRLCVLQDPAQGMGGQQRNRIRARPPALPRGVSSRAEESGGVGGN